jgi:hypothetical protein
MNSRLFIGGDFIAEHTHWGSRLYKAAADTGCEIVSSGKPTYWPTDKKKTLPDLLDFFVVKNISTNYIKIKEGLDMNSDHSSICLTVSDKIIAKDQNPV